MPELMISGIEGKMQAHYSPSQSPEAPLVLILHPHPLHGGTMNNKVVYNLYHIFSSRGFACLRFNFRGVGASAGRYSKGEGELNDAATALDWLQQQHDRGRQCWVAGFSFGGWIALQLLMRRPEIFRFVAVAPPVNLYDFNFLSPCPTSGLLVQGTEDTIVPCDEQSSMIRNLALQPNINVNYEIIEGANHFMSDHMGDLQDIVGRYIEDNMHLKDDSLRSTDSGRFDSNLDFLLDGDDDDADDSDLDDDISDDE